MWWQYALCSNDSDIGLNGEAYFTLSKWKIITWHCAMAHSTVGWLAGRLAGWCDGWQKTRPTRLCFVLIYWQYFKAQKAQMKTFTSDQIDCIWAVISAAIQWINDLIGCKSENLRRRLIVVAYSHRCYCYSDLHIADVYIYMSASWLIGSKAIVMGLSD